MTKKYFSALLSMTLVLSVLPQSVAYAKDFTIRDVEEGGASNSYRMVLDEYVETINEKDWSSYKECFSQDIQEELAYFPTVQQIQEHTGLLSVDEISIKEIKEIELDEAKTCEPRFVDIEESDYDDVFCYYVGFDYSVKEEYENEFYYDGTKYSFVIIGSNNGVEEIVGFEDAYYFDTIDEVGVSFESKEEEKAEEVVDNRNRGLITNYSGDVLGTIGDVAIVASTENSSRAIARSYISEPEIIKVSVNGTVKSMSLNNYTANVLPNEWYMSWNDASLKAGAVTIRMFGWYNVLHPRKPATTYGAHVDNTTEYQVFVDGSATTKSLLIVQQTETIAMLDTNGNVFEPQYRAGTSSTTTQGKNGGIMYQWGTKYLGDKNYSYKGICNYYFANSYLCSGSITWTTIN